MKLYPGIVISLLSVVRSISLTPSESRINDGVGSGRVVAVGDLHGDYYNALRVFQMANLTNYNGDWIGGTTTLVQTGDVIDRGPDTIELFKWLFRLRDQAKEAGGNCILLLGNHEIMNLQEDYRYVSEEDSDSFGGVSERKEAFSMDGWIGKELRQHSLSAQIGDTVFVHGGINSRWSKSYSVDHLNRHASKYLKSDSPQKLKTRNVFKSSAECPTWYRGFAKGDEPEICDKLTTSLNYLGANRMVMGHSITGSRHITPRCGGRILLIDTAISSVFGNGRLSALELINDKATAINPDGTYDQLPTPYSSYKTKEAPRYKKKLSLS